MSLPVNDDHVVRLVAADDPRTVAATEAVQAGDLAALERMLAADPWLATARIGDWDELFQRVAGALETRVAGNA